MVKVFAEGGGKRGSKALFQRALARLIAKAAPGAAADVVACGARGEALRRFARALAAGGPVRALLLVDGERPVREGHRGKPWAHLAEAPDRWQKPRAAGDDSAHLMAQCMESWLVADPDALAAHFGPGFNAAKLPGDADLEAVAKSDILGGLAAAAKGSRRGEYRKAYDGCALIGKIDPSRVAQRARHAGRFFGVLRREFAARKEGQ